MSIEKLEYLHTGRYELEALLYTAIDLLLKPDELAGLRPEARVELLSDKVRERNSHMYEQRVAAMRAAAERDKLVASGGDRDRLLNLAGWSKNHMYFALNHVLGFNFAVETAGMLLDEIARNITRLEQEDRNHADVGR